MGVFGYFLIVSLSVAVGVVVYRVAGRVPLPEEGSEDWAASHEPAAPKAPPTNFERLSVSRERRSWHDRAIGILGLVVAVALGAAAVAFSLYLVGRAAVALLEQAATGPA